VNRTPKKGTILNHFVAYGFATLATLVKTVAWWFNRFPLVNTWSFFAKWIASAAIAGLEYLPLTYSFQYATGNFVALSLMTAYMTAVDNLFRMLQQLGLGLYLGWYDWVAAMILALAVVFQGVCHYYHDKSLKLTSTSDVNETIRTISNEALRVIIPAMFILTAILSLAASLLGGPVGQTYTLATLATGEWIYMYMYI